MPNDRYQDWLLVTAVALSLVAAGAVIDFLLKEREVARLHKRFIDLAAILRETPLRTWQIRVADVFIRVLSNLHRVTLLAMVAIGRSAFRPLLAGHPWLGYVQAIALSVVVVWALSALFRTEAMSTHAWILETFGLLVALLPFALLDFVKRTMLSDLLSSSILISLAVTTMALLISTEIPATAINSFWFENVGENVIPASPFLLAGINWIFDFATVLTTVVLLAYVRGHGRFIGLIAILDIGISGALTLLLYLVLRLLSGEPFGETSVLAVLAQSLEWFMLAGQNLFDMIRQTPPLLSQRVQDLHLFPVLLSTFVPTAMYMSVFVLLSSAKLIMGATSRVLEAVGERNESVFRQFGVLIATLMAATKAVYDYLITL